LIDRRIGHPGAVHLDWLEKDSDWDAARDHPKFKAIVEYLS